MRLIPLTSSSIAAIGYAYDEYYTPDSPDPYYSGPLVVQFQTKSGDWSAYRYDSVPMDVFVDIVTNPESQGKEFHRRVKMAGYPYEKVTPEQVQRM